VNLTVLYFARLREAVGTGRESLAAPPEVRRIGDLRHWLAARGEPWASAFAGDRAVRAALDQTMAGDAAELHDGAEVAFFPPVTGG
jgi:sulfur-carrier protein